MSQQFELTAQPRNNTTRAIRQADAIPAVLYGHGLTNRAVQIDQRQFAKIFNQAGYTSLIDLTIAGEDTDDTKDATHTVLIREVQLHPLRNTPLHIDFYQVRLDQTIRAHVPLNFTGESIAVKDLGGVLVRNLDEVELEALPTDLPHDIAVDISTLKDFDTTIHVSDLTLPDGVKLFHEPDDVVALVQAPRTEEELEALDQEVAEDVEGVAGVEEEKSEEEQATTDEKATDTAPADSDQTKPG